MTTETYSDVDGRYLRNAQTSDLTKSVDLDALRNSVKNILLTRKTERRMMPLFGASLEQLLFEPIDELTAKKLGSAMIDELTYWEPRVIVTNIDITADPDKMRYDVILEYYVQSPNITNDTISFVLQG
jgi:hypothetical protein